MTEPTIVLANGLFQTSNGKVTHGLIRGSDRFRVVAVVDPDTAGQDAGQVLDGIHRGIPVVATMTFDKGIGAKYVELEITDSITAQQPEFNIKEWE